MHKSKLIERHIKNNPGLVDKYYVENDGGDWSHWVDLEYGWTNSYLGCHTIHESTARETLAQLQAVEPCDCSDCVAGLLK